MCLHVSVSNHLLSHSPLSFLLMYYPSFHFQWYFLSTMLQNRVNARIWKGVSSPLYTTCEERRKSSVLITDNQVKVFAFILQAQPVVNRNRSVERMIIKGTKNRLKGKTSRDCKGETEWSNYQRAVSLSSVCLFPPSRCAPMPNWKCSAGNEPVYRLIITIFSISTRYCGHPWWELQRGE